MNSDLRNRYIRDLVSDLGQVSGLRFEAMASILFTELIEKNALNRGLNLDGAPVGNIVDSMNATGSRVAQYSSMADFFSVPYNKIFADIRESRNKHSSLKELYLFSSRECGPKANTILTRIKSRIDRWLKLKVEIYDARQIAEFIVDRLLMNDRVVNLLKSYFPNLERIAEQSAMSNQLPPISSSYLGRHTEERNLIEELASESVVSITGIAGIGKTEFACAVAHKIGARYELLIWVQADEVTNIEQLHAFDVRRNGYRQNLVGLLRSHRTLLILDNLLASLDQGRLASECRPGSNIIITTQVKPKINAFDLPMLSREAAELLLCSGVSTSCPPAILQRVWETVGGHPLVLRIMNGHLRHDAYSWKDIESDCTAVGEQEDDRRQRIADRILMRHASVIGRECSFIAWCATPLIDRDLLRFAIQPMGIQKLNDRCLLVRAQSDVVRVHDIVYQSILANRAIWTHQYVSPEATIARYIGNVIPAKGLPLFRVIHRHLRLIEATLRGGSSADAIVYAYLLTHEPSDIDPTLVPDPRSTAENLSALSPEALQIRLILILEIIEALFRWRRHNSSSEQAKLELSDRMSIYDSLLEEKKLSPAQHQYIRHHRAKSILKLQGEAAALAEFEEIADAKPVPAQTRLQLARLYSEQPEKAWTQLRSLFEDELAQPGAVTTSILLEAIATLMRKQMAPYVKEATEKYGDLIVQSIKSSACSGFDQPLRSYAAIGRNWWIHAPERFLDIYRALETLDEADGEDDAFAVAEIHKNAGKLFSKDKQESAANEAFITASEWYSRVSVKTPYQIRCAAENLILLKRFSEADLLLDTVPEPQRDEHWSYRKAQSLHGLGDNKAALAQAEASVAKEKKTSQYTETYKRFLDFLRKHPC